MLLSLLFVCFKERKWPKRDGEEEKKTFAWAEKLMSIVVDSINECFDSTVFENEGMLLSFNSSEGGLDTPLLLGV